MARHDTPIPEPRNRTESPPGRRGMVGAGRGVHHGNDRTVTVVPISKRRAADLVIQHHYLHRRPPISYAFGLEVDAFTTVGVCTFGSPPSRNVQISVCPSDPSLAIELNRLWLHDDLCWGTATWFVSRCLRSLPPLIVFSYADTAVGHHGGVYRAMSWNYAGRTDEDRQTPRFDYQSHSGKHPRDVYRSGDFGDFVRVRREPKHRYWTTTGSAKQRRKLAARCGWSARPYPQTEAS